MARVFDAVLKYSQVMVGVGTGVLVCASLYPQTLGLDSCRRFYAQYSGEKEQPLDLKTKFLTEKVVMEVGLQPEEEAGLDFFTIYSQDPRHWGSIKTRTGAYVGLPATFTYTHPSQVQTDKIHLNNIPIDWSSRSGQLLLNSLVLSENAKKFAISREIQYANTYHVLIDMLLKSTFAFSAYACGFFVNNFLRLRTILKRWGRGIVFSLVGTTFLVLYVLTDDTYSCRSDLSVDLQSAKLGHSYAEGGVELYNKLLQRNMALKVLLGSEGSHLYTTYGNKMATWRRPHATLTERRDQLASYLSQIQQTNTD